MSVTIPLSKPITVGNVEHKVLELREPTVEDVMDIGYPFLVVETDNGSGMELRPKIVMKYASRLGAVPPSALKGLSLADLSKLQAAVMGFFGEETVTSPS